MSRQYNRCVLCGDTCQISDTNCDIDLGFMEIHDKIIFTLEVVK